MNRKLALILIVSGMLFSCEKEKHNVHFHGRVVTNCNPQMPAKFERVSLHRYYDTGISGGEWLGETWTDANGNFSFTTDVNQKGDFRSYILNMYLSMDINQRHYSTHLQSYNDTKDVLINATASPSGAYGFHIKNIAPVNNGDMFNALVTEFTFNNVYTHTISENLAGTGVDTTIYRFYVTPPVYKFSYTKNGTLHETEFDSLPQANCMDTVMVDVFY